MIQATGTEPETARLTADVVLFGEQDGRLHVLLICRRWPPFEGCWALPGGHVDPGEHTHAAAHRELAEETGIFLEIGGLRLVDVYSTPGRDPRGRYVTFAYSARLPYLPAPTAADDAAQAEWIPVDEALSGTWPLAFDHMVILHDSLKAAA